MSTVSKKKVLILDGETRSALAVLRSLGKKNHICYVSSHDLHAIAFASKYVYANLVSPRLEMNDSQSHGWLLKTIKNLHIDYIIPTTERTLLSIYSNKELTSYLQKLPFPSLETFSALTDKYKLTDLLAAGGLSYPKTTLIEDSTYESLEKAISFPSIIKPRRSIAVQGHNKVPDITKTPVAYVRTKEDLKRLCSGNYFKNHEEYIAQDYVAGPGVGLFFLIKDGKVITSFSHQRILEKPPEGGVSVLSKSIHVSDSVLESFSRFLISQNWQGVAMIECKEINGNLTIIEINPRFWGSLQLAIDSNADFPNDLLELNSEKHQWNFFSANKTLRWELGSLDHALIRLKKTPMDTLIDILFKNALKLSTKNRLEILRADDPRPFFQELQNYFRWN